MHFHLPKPLHGWREFAGEVGIIVLGVLIALGAEQVVETLHWRSEIADARRRWIGRSPTTSERSRSVRSRDPASTAVFRKFASY
jgi:hypothetical protein